jgi:predicted regulator of Ras-like GTPase activity (Roadblock/LC7/MglB family)
LKGDLPEIGDDQLVELPYSLVEPQLASGRVAIEPKVFQQSIPEKYRDLFVIDTAETPVLLPLQEVLQHLPGDALQMRQDQEREEAIDHFETPFSHHAKEDQKRFGAEPLTAKSEPAKPVESGADAPKPETVSAESSKEAIEKPQPAEASPAAAKSTVDAAPAATEPASPSPGADTKPVDAQVPEPASTASEDKAQAEPAVLPETATLEAKHNAKEYVLKASCLPGITACAISFADGLTMAGNFPPSAGAEGLCAMAPSVLQKIDKHMLETNLGTLTAITLHCSKTPVSFFMRGNVCLSVMHADEQLEPVTRIQLAEMTKELAEIFAQPELTHVDH